MSYTNGMSDVSFQLDIAGGEEILTEMIAPLIKQSGEAIGARARAMAASMSSDPPDITVEVTTQSSPLGGRRTVALVKSLGKDAHQSYIGTMALAKSKDAGRVS